MSAKRVRHNVVTALCIVVEVVVAICLLLPMYRVNDSYGQIRTTQDGERIQEIDALIDSLANHNPEPQMEKVDHQTLPLFDASYDWKEQRRIRDALESLAQQEGDDLWPRLLEHFDDKRYSLTYKGDGAHNASVGELCYGMALRDIECAYAPFLHFLHFEHFHIVYSPDELKKWGGERKNKPLWELQIEMAEGSLEKLQKKTITGRTNGGNASEETVAFVTQLRKQIEAVKKEKRPILIKTSFLRDWAFPFSEKQAMEIRAKYSALKQNTRPQEK